MRIEIERHSSAVLDLVPERDLEPDHLERFNHYVDRRDRRRARQILEEAAVEIVLGRGRNQEWDNEEIEADLSWREMVF